MLMKLQQPASVTSPIHGMHARFEANNQEYNLIEAAQAQADDNDMAERGKLDRAIAASEAEADALRLAILTQVPDDWKAALILQFHIRIEHDFQANAARAANLDQPRKDILSTAIDTLFDFMACEIDADHEAIGPQMQSACNQVFFARRYRTGMLED